MSTSRESVSSHNDKKQALLDAARALFWKHGFRRVTVQDICAQADVSKMTFYRFFQNKTDIAKAVFGREADAGMERFRKLMREKSTPEEKIRKLILMKSEGVHDVSREFLQDFYSGSQNEMRGFIEEKTRSSWLLMLKDFKAAQRKGYFRKDFKPEFLFLLTGKFTELLNDPTINKLYKKPEDLIMEITRFTAYGISPPAKKK